MVKAMKQLGVACVLTIAVVGSAACRDEAKPQAGASPVATSQSSSGPSAAPQPRMRSLKVADKVAENDGAPSPAQADPAPTVLGNNSNPNNSNPAPAPTVLGNNSSVSQSSSGVANRQVVNLRTAPRNVHVRQDGGGNSQVLNVDATGGNITQRQSGSGNFQSMNVGITDNLPARSSASKP
jgi:hypothetical protein